MKKWFYKNVSDSGGCCCCCCCQKCQSWLGLNFFNPSA